jgi:hypothetical protein
MAIVTLIYKKPYNNVHKKTCINKEIFKTEVHNDDDFDLYLNNF